MNLLMVVWVQTPYLVVVSMTKLLAEGVLNRDSIQAGDETLATLLDFDAQSLTIEDFTTI